MIKELVDGKKTYIVSFIAFLIALLYTIEGYLTDGDLRLEGLSTSFIALALIFLRQGIKKEGG